MNKQVKILALGDSYTIGESVLEKERWPTQLSDQLKSNGFNVLPPKIVAVTGWTTDELLAGIDTAQLDKHYDLVTVLIGVNNQYRGRDTINYREELTKILKSAISLAGNSAEKVLVLSIPDWGRTPFAADRDRNQIAKEINSYNIVKQDITESLGLKFIDITDISRMADSNPKFVAEDGLHPSGEMYSRWVKRMLPYVIEILEDPT